MRDGDTNCCNCGSRCFDGCCSSGVCGVGGRSTADVVAVGTTDPAADDCNRSERIKIISLLNPELSKLLYQIVAGHFKPCKLSLGD